MHMLTCEGPNCYWDKCPERTSQVDHAWATIPAETRGTEPNPDAAPPARPVPPRGPLERVATIAAWVAYSGFVFTIAAIIGVWLMVEMVSR